TSRHSRGRPATSCSSTAKTTVRSGSCCSVADARRIAPPLCRVSPLRLLQRGRVIASALLLLPDFLLIALGAAMKRVRAFDAPFWRGLERFVYFVLFPALLFRARATATMSLGDASRLVVVGVLFTLAGMALS